jgi:hypothetical protein
VLVDLQLDSTVAGGLSTGALLAGFIAFEAPALTRFVWQPAAAPAIGAELLGREPVTNAVVLTIAAGCSFALLAIQYALFTTATTVYIVVLSHALGQADSQAADERAIATVIGIVIAALAFVLLRDIEPARNGS